MYLPDHDIQFLYNEYNQKPIVVDKLIAENERFPYEDEQKNFILHLNMYLTVGEKNISEQQIDAMLKDFLTKELKVESNADVFPGMLKAVKKNSLYLCGFFAAHEYFAKHIKTANLKTIKSELHSIEKILNKTEQAIIELPVIKDESAIDNLKEEQLIYKLLKEEFACLIGKREIPPIFYLAANRVINELNRDFKIGKSKIPILLGSLFVEFGFESEEYRENFISKFNRNITRVVKPNKLGAYEKILIEQINRLNLLSTTASSPE